MGLIDQIKNYIPYNQQEEMDRLQMLQFMEQYDDYLSRENAIGHVTTSIWVMNKEWTKVLMVYHKIYDSWSWPGGHADGIEDLPSVAMRELEEETGIKNARLVSEEIFSLETLPVLGHVKKGNYVPSHLHFNLTYLAEAEEEELLSVNPQENDAVKWWPLEEALEVSTEPWMVEWIYKKLIQKGVRDDVSTKGKRVF